MDQMEMAGGGHPELVVRVGMVPKVDDIQKLARKI